VQNAQICNKYCRKAFGSRALTGTADGAYSAPHTQKNGLREKGREWKGKEGKERIRREGKEAREKERKGEGGHYSLLSDFLATPMLSEPSRTKSAL